MKYKISVKTLLSRLSILMLLFYAFFYGLRYQLLKNTVMLVAFLFLSVVFLMLSLGKFKKNAGIMPYISLICIGIILLNRNARFSNGLYMFDFGIVILFISYLFLSYSMAWHNFAKNLLVILGIFYGVSTILLFLFPDVYINIVAPLFGGDYMRSMIRKAQQGLAIGFSNHYSTTGMYLVATLGLPISVFTRNDTFEKRQKKWAMFLVGICLVALLLTGKRAHSIFTILSVFVAYYFMNPDKKMGRVFKIVGAVFVVIGLFYIASELYPPLQNIITRFQSTLESGDVTLGRSGMIFECLSMFKKNPLVGTGWGSFTYRTITGVVNAHNVYIQLIGENGIILSIPFFVFIFGNFYHSIQAAVTGIKHGYFTTKGEMITMSYSLFIQTFLILYCMTGNPFYDFQFLCPYMMACAMGEFYYRKHCFTHYDEKQQKRQRLITSVRF